MACGSKENLISPFPVSPCGGKPGRGAFPPRREHAARQQKALAGIDAAGSPHKRAAAPLWIPRERVDALQAGVGQPNEDGVDGGHKTFDRTTVVLIKPDNLKS